MPPDLTTESPTGHAFLKIQLELAEVRAEKEVLLSLSNEMAKVRSKEDLARIITHTLKDLFQIKDYTILVINEDEKSWSHFATS